MNVRSNIVEDIKFELRRKLVHLLSGVYIIFYYFMNNFFGKRIAIFSLVLILMFLLQSELLQIKFGKRLPFFYKLYREYEKKNFSGSVYLLIGVIVAFSLFDFNLATAAISMMILGDTASKLVGYFGKIKIRGMKTPLEGILAELIVNFAIGFVFIQSVPIIFAMAVAATIIEMIIMPLDDNLVIPIAAGFAGEAATILFKAFGR